jgi:hypothetical protein
MPDPKIGGMELDAQIRRYRTAHPELSYEACFRAVLAADRTGQRVSYLAEVMPRPTVPWQATAGLDLLEAVPTEQRGNLDAVRAALHRDPQAAAVYLQLPATIRVYQEEIPGTGLSITAFPDSGDGEPSQALRVEPRGRGERWLVMRGEQTLATFPTEREALAWAGSLLR